MPTAKKAPASRPAKTPVAKAVARVAAVPAKKARPAARKAATKTATAKVAAPPAERAAATEAVPQAPQAKADKARKAKLVRDSFTIPKQEYGVLEDLKARAASLGRPTKKSEVLRAGIQALAAMGDDAFLACVGAVPAVKTGRPARDGVKAP
jgi:hypothetical protein